MFNVYYTVYHRQSMKTIKDKLDRSGLIYFLYETWYKDISQVFPPDYNPEVGSLNKDIDIDGLIKAVNEEGVLLINRSYDVEL
ncbi:TreF [Staphylococcus phage CF7]|nr:TreF [Staphylococcus phage CF7]